MEGTAFDTIWLAACEGVMLGLSVGYVVLAIMHRVAVRFGLEPGDAAAKPIARTIDQTENETLDRAPGEAICQQTAAQRDLLAWYGLLNVELPVQQVRDELRLLTWWPNAWVATASRLM